MHVSSFFAIRYFLFRQEVTIKTGNTYARLAQLILTTILFKVIQFSFHFKVALFNRSLYKCYDPDFERVDRAQW